MNNLVCGMVGALIRDPVGRFLIIYRRVKPMGWTVIGGHIEDFEAPGDALRRVVEAKTCIVPLDIYRCLIQIASFSERENMRYRCHHGAKTHFWYVYKVKTHKGQPELKDTERYTSLKFATVDEIKELIAKENFNPAWSRFILPALGVL